MKKLEEQLEFEFMKEERLKKNTDRMMLLLGATSIVALSDINPQEHQINVAQMITAVASVITYGTCLSYLVFYTPYLDKCTDYIKSLIKKC